MRMPLQVLISNSATDFIRQAGSSMRSFIRPSDVWPRLVIACLRILHWFAGKLLVFVVAHLHAKTKDSILRHWLFHWSDVRVEAASERHSHFITACNATVV
jgi:hypothetical protein